MFAESVEDLAAWPVLHSSSKATWHATLPFPCRRSTSAHRWRPLCLCAETRQEATQPICKLGKGEVVAICEARRDLQPKGGLEIWLLRWTTSLRSRQTLKTCVPFLRVCAVEGFLLPSVGELAQSVFLDWPEMWRRSTPIPRSDVIVAAHQATGPSRKSSKQRSSSARLSRGSAGFV